MKIAFYGAAHEVTGSCSVIYAAGKTVMIDAGLEQGPDIYENCELPIPASEIDCLLLTHAHIDHSGKIPYLVKHGFKGKIYATKATEKLCRIMLMDSAHIQEFEARWQSRKAKRSGESPYEPLYTTKDAAAALEMFIGCDYEKDYNLYSGISIRFTDAGHLLGSSSISITLTEGDETRTVCFSGDLGNKMRPLICDPKQPSSADYTVIESTYGDRIHGKRIDYVTQLTRVIQTTFNKGGNLVIPCFAIGRTQELLYLIRIIKERGLISGHESFPVYVDSPLAVEATEIYSSDLTDYFDDETLAMLKAGKNPIKFKDLRLSLSSDDSIAINQNDTPKIILSASGMCEAGRIRHHLKHNLWRKDSTVLFVGYQSEGTLGRLILDGARRVKLFGEDVKVNAKIERLEGSSSHADREMLLEWLSGFSKAPTTVFVNHGEDSVCENFARTIRERLSIDAKAPYSGSVYDLISGEIISEGNTEKKTRSNVSDSKLQRASSAYPMLKDAMTRLNSLSESYREGANKDIAALAKLVNELCDRWEK